MEKRLFVGDLPKEMDETALAAAFSEHGTVVKAEVIRDKETQKSKGFGFVEMETEEEAEKALGAMNGTSIEGQPIKVNEAPPRKELKLKPVEGVESW